MKITVTIEISDSVFRGLIVGSLQRGITVPERVAQCVSECTPALKHRHSDDWSRYAMEELPAEDFEEVRQLATFTKCDLEHALNRYFIQKQLQAEGIRLVQQEFSF